MNCRDCGQPFTPRDEEHIVCLPCVARKAKEMAARTAGHSPLVSLTFQTTADIAINRQETA